MTNQLIIYLIITVAKAAVHVIYCVPLFSRKTPFLLAIRIKEKPASHFCNAGLYQSLLLYTSDTIFIILSLLKFISVAISS